MQGSERVGAVWVGALLLALIAASAGACGGDSDDAIVACSVGDTSPECTWRGRPVTLTVDSHPNLTDPFEWQVPVSARAHDLFVRIR